MKIVQINATCGKGSTGKICLEISKMLTAQGVENYILYSALDSDHPLGIKYSNQFYTKIQALKSRILGNYGFNSGKATKKIIANLNQIQPDIVHLHNIHAHNCDLDLLFKFFRKKRIKLIWTFHDCWAFTGYCPHFAMVGCNRWTDGCHDCPQKKEFSWFFDRSSRLYKKKKELFSGLDLTIVTPSQWLADLVKRSFLGECPVKVINNGIDLSIFMPTESDFRQKNGLVGKRIVLGVAFDWGERKGLDVFIDLAKRLDDSYKIILVGTNDEVDTQLPDNIMSIHRTHDQKELAEIYTAADVFVQTTREENYPTVNMESLACGTPVVTFRTGGSPEILDETCGCVVECNDNAELLKQIRRICENALFTKEACLKRAENFDASARFLMYTQLYRDLTK